MNLAIEESGPFSIARINGEWRSSDEEDHVEKLHRMVASPDSKLAIDLSGLKMLDSGGLSVLINLVTRARLTRSRVVLVSPSPFVAGVFEVTHLDKWFEICADMRQAGERLKDA